MSKFNKLFYIGLILFIFPLVLLILPFLFKLMEPTPPIEKYIHYDTVKIQIPIQVYDTIKIEKIITKTKYIENDTTNTSN